MVDRILNLIAQASETERLLAAKDVTTAGVLLVGIIILGIGFLRGWIVPGWQYRKLENDRDRWMSLAWAAASAAKTGVQTAHEATRTLRKLAENGAGPAEPPGVPDPLQQPPGLP